MRKLFYRIAASLSVAFMIGWAPAGGAFADVTYTYDSQGRLASAVYATFTIFYTYDLNGSRLTQVVQADSTVGVWNSFNWGAAHW